MSVSLRDDGERHIDDPTVNIDITDQWWPDAFETPSGQLCTSFSLELF